MDGEKQEFPAPASQTDLEAQRIDSNGGELRGGPTLEQEQSGWREARRRSDQGSDVSLTELALPEIFQEPAQEERREELNEEAFERGLEQTGDYRDLSEIAVPPLVKRVPSRRGDWAALESAESRVTKPPPKVVAVAGIEARLSEYATRFYTISYLIFFSIFGALARIGLQSLTTYPGAPVATGITWANVGGCILMGFFAEDRKLFREEWGQWKRTHPKPQSDRSTSISPSDSRPPPSPHLHRRHHAQEQQLQQQQQQPSQQSPPPEQKGTTKEDTPLDPASSIQAHKSIKKTIPLYIGLTTGFCGSFTSFSTFMLDVFLALSNDLRTPDLKGTTPTPRNGGYSFMALISIILYTLALSLSALVFGAHLAIYLDDYTPVLPYLFSRKFLDRIIVPLAAGCWLGAVFLTIWPPDRHLGVHEYWRGRALFAIVFAPLGCLTRFYVSLWLNARVPRFPLGTFVVNVLGTMVLGMCFDLQRASGVVGSSSLDASGAAGAVAVTVAQLTGCQVLQGVMDGFCGCMTTVSTWVAELDSLEHKHAYIYGIVSVGVSLAALVVIVGSMRWTVGFGGVVC
ncbi:hypothetical protein FQN51_007215 [Onygenales sp. PD_10]|nr:hypothetical protein FQN51_007215 [Onygenales sp. PD_10]